MIYFNQVLGSGFWVKGLQTIETVHEIYRDAEYSA